MIGPNRKRAEVKNKIKNSKSYILCTAAGLTHCCRWVVEMGIKSISVCDDSRRSSVNRVFHYCRDNPEIDMNKNVIIQKNS